MALVLLSVIIGLLIGEGIARFFRLAPEVNSLSPGLKKSVFKLSSNSVLGYELKENYRDNDHPNLVSSYPYTNANGQRDIERTYEKPKGVKRIIMLGDSIVCGMNLKEMADTIPGQLEKFFGQNNIEVLNFGVNGYCTRSEVELLKERGLRYKPDLVILLFVNNDYINLNNDLGIVSLDRPKIVEKMFVHSYLFRYLCLQLNLFHMRDQYGLNNVVLRWVGYMDRHGVEMMKMSRDASSMTLSKHINAVGENNVENGLKLLKELSERYDFRVMIAVWPTFESGRIMDYETHEGGKNALPPGQKLYVEQLAENYGIPCFRLSPHFRRIFEGGNKTGLKKNSPDILFAQKDDIHPNKYGTAVAAEILKSIIDDNPALLKNGKDK